MFFKCSCCDYLEKTVRVNLKKTFVLTGVALFSFSSSHVFNLKINFSKVRNGSHCCVCKIMGCEYT